MQTQYEKEAIKFRNNCAWMSAWCLVCFWVGVAGVVVFAEIAEAENWWAIAGSVAFTLVARYFYSETLKSFSDLERWTDVAATHRVRRSLTGGEQ